MDGPEPQFLELVPGGLRWDWHEAPPDFRAADLIGFHVTRAQHSILNRDWVTPHLEYDVIQGSDGRVPYFINLPEHSGCSMYYGYTVEAVFRGGRRSPASLALYFTTDPCFLPVDVTVRFESITINEGVNDHGDCCIICPVIDRVLEMEINPQVISASDRWHEYFYYTQIAGTWNLSSSHVVRHVVHITDPRQTLTINVGASDDDPPCVGTGLRAGSLSCFQRELPALTTEQWRRMHLHMIGSCDYPEDHTAFTFSVYIDGPQW